MWNRAALGLSVVALLSLAACSGSDGAPAGGSTSSSSVNVSSVVTSAAPGATVQPLPVIGSGATSDGDTPLRIDLNEVRVTDQVMTVSFTVTNTTPDQDAQKWQVAQFFHKGSGFTVNGVYVLDAKNATRYLPATTAEGGCVCSSDLVGTFIGPGRSMVFQASFKAPPADVTQVQVAIPKVQPFAAQIVR